MRRPLLMMRGQEGLHPSWPAKFGLTRWTAHGMGDLWGGCSSGDRPIVAAAECHSPTFHAGRFRSGPRLDNAASAAETSSAVALQPPDSRTPPKWRRKWPRNAMPLTRNCAQEVSNCNG